MSRFPSPCGDVVLKSRRRLWVSLTPMKFPSPCGDVLYSPPPSDGGGGERCEPVGALTADVTFSRWRYADRSRRPFHHASHGPPPPLWQGRLGFVRSVPLRGCGFEIMLMRKSAQIRLKFPSPCGDVVLKFSDSWNEYAKALAGFPSPCGDVVLKYSRIHRQFLFRFRSGFRPLAKMWF